MFFILLGLGSPYVFAESTLVFRIQFQGNGFPPYVILEKGEETKGILVEVLEHIAFKHKITVHFRKLPRNRVLGLLETGGIDAAPMAKEWVSEPNRFVFTAPIARNRDVLFSLKSNPVIFSTPKDLSGIKIITRLGFKYPTFELWFKSGKIKRRDGNDEYGMLKMLLLKRGECAIINHLTGLWVIKQNPDLQNIYFVSDKEVADVGYRLVFNKKWKSFVMKFNNDLALMKKNGELKRIMSAYQ